MLQSTEKYISVINGRIKETSSKTVNSYSLKQLSLILGVKRTTVKKWIAEDVILPSWALQKLHLLPNNSGYIRSMEKSRDAFSYLDSVINDYESIITKTRRDGTPMDIPANLVPEYTPPEFSLRDQLIRRYVSVSESSKCFVTSLSAVGRKDNRNTGL